VAGFKISQKLGEGIRVRVRQASFGGHPGAWPDPPLVAVALSVCAGKSAHSTQWSPALIRVVRHLVAENRLFHRQMHEQKPQ